MPAKNDSQCLPSLLENTQVNLRAASLKMKEALMDAGYSSTEAPNALKQYHITGYVPNFGLYKPERRPLRITCIGKSKFKKIVGTLDKYLYDEMHQRLQTRKVKRMKKLRQSTVEQVIGTLINFLGMRRMNTSGIKRANKCLLMAAVCYTSNDCSNGQLTALKTREKRFFGSFSCCGSPWFCRVEKAA